MVPPRFREIGFGLLIAVVLAGCAALSPSPLSEGCRQGGAYWSECRRYAIVKREGGVFFIQRDGQVETLESFPSRDTTEAKLLRCYLQPEGCPLEPQLTWLAVAPATSTPIISQATPPSSYVPLVDAAMVKDPDKFRLDLAQCRDLATANTARDQALSSGIGGAAAGAAFGALMGLAVGLKPGQLAPAGALGGGVGGLATGAVNQEATYQQIYKNCMIGRGWQVLR